VIDNTKQNSPQPTDYLSVGASIEQGGWGLLTGAPTATGPRKPASRACNIPPAPPCRQSVPAQTITETFSDKRVRVREGFLENGGVGE